MPPEQLSPQQMERYQAHLALPEFGPEGQRRLRQSRVAVVGLGGLGCPVTLYLAAAGVGALTLIDDDVVDRTNLQRQVLYGEGDIGAAKALVAGAKVASLNPEVEVTPVQRRVTPGTVRDLLAGHDLVIDGSDNFATRYVVNDACVLDRMPLVSGSLYRYEGQVMVVIPGSTACYRCVFPASPAEPPACHEAGVLGPLAGIVGSVQASEALQLLGQGSSRLAGRLLLIDALAATTRSIETRRDRGCAICGDNPTLREPTAVASCEPAHG